MPDTIPFSDFLTSAGVEHEDFINQLHTYLQENNCITKIKIAANGYVVSYMHKPSKRTVMNYIFRKGLPMLRVYADHVSTYMDVIAQWPDSMKDAIRTGGNCARLSNPTACNSRCLLGFDFILDGQRLQKCRCHMSFTFFLNDETKPHLADIMQREMQARLSKEPS